MSVTVDTVVIGGGAMGSSAAWHLARRGVEVLLLERFEPGHTNGASHGASRNFNVAYADPTYVSMLVEALPLWRELEAESGNRILETTGVVNHGPGADFDRVYAALTASGIPAEFVSVPEANERWPGIRFDTRVLFNPTGGRLNADLAVASLQKAAVARGATVRHSARVTRLEVLDDSVRVAFEGPDAPAEVTARHAVVTAGAWTHKLLGRTVDLPSLTVTQEQPAHFAVLDDSVDWPGFNHAPGDTGYEYWRSPIYGMLTPGQGIKAGWHGTGPIMDPDARTFLPEERQLDDLRHYVRDWLPGADPDRFEAISCTYTTPPDSNFVIDRSGPVVVGAGFSGHGFKFVPTVGRMLADLVAGRSALGLFRLGAREPVAHTGFGSH